MNIIFKGKTSADINGLIINSVQRGLLSTQNARLLKITGKKGSYDFGTDEDIRKYTVSSTLIRNSLADLEAGLEELAGWLYTGGQTQELIFDTNMQVSYYGKVEGDTQITQVGTTALINFSFICPDPTGEGVEKSFDIAQGTDTVDVVNDGNADAFPLIKATVKKDASSIIVANGDKYVMLGTPINATKPMQQSQTTVLYDQLMSLDGWTQGVAIDGGVLSGTFVSDGYTFSQANNDFGTGSQWHGAAMIKSLPNPVQDFEVTAYMSFQGSAADMIGRAELYLLDANGSHFGKIAMVDPTSYGNMQVAEACVGSWARGDATYFVNDTGAFYGVWSDWNLGLIRIGRRGTTWYAYLGIMPYWGAPMHAELWRQYDDGGKWQQQLAAIQIHLGAFMSFRPYDLMNFQDIVVTQFNSVDSSNSNDVPFKTNDILLIDCEKAAVYKNGEPCFGLLNPASDFFSVPSGKSTIGVTPNDIADINITFKNKYL